MKRLLILLLSLLVFSFSFSWEKIRQSDEFGDPTKDYALGEVIKEGYGTMMVGKNNEGAKVAGFIFSNDYFSEKKAVIKMKSVHGTMTVSGEIVNGKYMFFYGQEARKIILSLRDSSIVKFNFKGIPFSVSGVGFTKMYKEAYWQDFNLEKPIKKPPVGKEDDFWYY